MQTNRVVKSQLVQSQRDKSRLWMAGAAFAALVAMLAGWFLGIEPALAAASSADTSRATVLVTNTTHAAVLAQLVEDSRDKNRLSAEFATMTASIPDGTGIPDFVNQIDALADANAVTIAGISVADAQSYTPGATVVDALITAQSLAALKVSISVDGDYEKVLQFVDGLQTGARLFLVTGITTQVDSEFTEQVDAEITGLVYVLVPPGSVVAPVVDPTLAAEASAAVEVG
ncbi:hypothetical protein E3T55_01040 [Cryobacterium frigoriphilum]|uniref:Uncharacterized protein n=1 Tax=Cryobacterium frigoriphilum TaxID=1259150 RepID=A0A4R9ABA7_9MICO|nr:type 4a pilus biogenesis protein PilO [Cryobacterium frigoriphilum]TFD55425.1 hypothetical protein E3T55_01040 [Cryobacterium frigoriphilum]